MIFTYINNIEYNKQKFSEKTQLKSHESLIDMLIKKNCLIDRLNETREIGFKRNRDLYLVGLHAMRSKSTLDGKENYFTTDIIIDPKNYPGNSRALWSCKMSSKKVKRVKFIGIVNTHQDKYSENNLIPLNKINANDINKYIPVSVTERSTNIRSIICVLKYTREMN